jgi:hypothetical protein
MFSSFNLLFSISLIIFIFISFYLKQKLHLSREHAKNACFSARSAMKKMVILHRSFLRRRKPALRRALGACEQGASFTKSHTPSSMPLRVAPF